MNEDLKIDLNGDNTGAVVEWEDFQVMATFENQNAQPNVTVNTELTFVNEYAEQIQQWIANGLITEGIPIDFAAGASSTNVFSGIVDLMDDFRVIDPTTVKAKIKPLDGLNRLSDRSEGLTFQSLYDLGVITNSDFISVPYVAEKEFDFVDFAMLSVSIYLMIEQFQSQIRKVAQDAIDLVAIVTGGATGAAAAAVWQTALLLIDGAFATVILVSLVDMIRELLSFMISPVKFHKAIRLKTMLEKASAYLGYTYSSTISEILNNEIVFLPSKNEIIQDNQVAQLLSNLTINQPGTGIPQSSDYGYTFAELLNAVNIMFGAKVAVLNGNLEQHALVSNWWVKNSSYQMPDILIESYKYNTQDLIGTQLIQFQTDTQDYWTIENFDGTVSEIRTSQASANNQNNVLIKGFEKFEIPYALGNRKDGLNALEEKIRQLAVQVDKLVNFFGGSPTWESKVVARVGMLKISKDWFDVPKMMKMNSANKLDANHRTKWSSLYLWNTYIKYYSFVTGDANQWKEINDIEIPMGFEDFLLLINNSYFYDVNGIEAKIEKLLWTPNKDTATVSLKIRQKYQTNLIEQIL
jgi:hypothetical protein